MKTIIQEQNTGFKIVTLDGIIELSRGTTVSSGNYNYYVCGCHFDIDNKTMLVQTEIESIN